MNADEIVMALKNDAKWVKKISWANALTPGSAEFLAVSERITEAADLIESLQAQLAKYDEVAAEYGIDGKTMLTLAKSQIKTAQDNIKLQEQLTASQRRERAAVEAIRESLFDTGNQRPHLNRCLQCAKFITDSKQRKYKYGCTSLCGDALKVMAACGFKSYEPLIPFADEWRGPQEAGKGENNA